MDNITEHKAIDYDENVVKTIPYYNNFHKETIGLIKEYEHNCKKWLDIGCGTGVLVEKAYKQFPNTTFILADISDKMLNISKKKLGGISEEKIKYLYNCSSQEINNRLNEKVDVVTAIQVHHYLKPDQRDIATKNCYEILNKNGIYVTFENIKQNSDITINLQLKLWKKFQLESGRSIEAVNKHMSRFNKDYYPITIKEHLDLLKKSGFRYYEVFWVSQMQCGLYAIK